MLEILINIEILIIIYLYTFKSDKTKLQIYSVHIKALA